MTTESHHDWELFQFDGHTETTYVRRLAVPGGWLYQVSFISVLSSNNFQPPVFVPDAPAYVSALKDSLDHARKELARLDVELAKERGGAGTVAKLRIENHRMKPVYELARRWCNRPASVLKEGRTVLAADAELFARLHSLVHASPQSEPAHFACTPDQAPPASDNPFDLTDEDLEALRWLRENGNIPTGRSVECDDPQCGDSTWDHHCNAGWEDIPEAKRAIAVLDKLLGEKVDRG